MRVSGQEELENLEDEKKMDNGNLQQEMKLSEHRRNRQATGGWRWGDEPKEPKRGPQSKGGEEMRLPRKAKSRGKRDNSSSQRGAHSPSTLPIPSSISSLSQGLSLPRPQYPQSSGSRSPSLWASAPSSLWASPSPRSPSAPQSVCLGIYLQFGLDFSRFPSSQNLDMTRDLRALVEKQTELVTTHRCAHAPFPPSGAPQRC